MCGAFSKIISRGRPGGGNCWFKLSAFKVQISEFIFYFLIFTLVVIRKTILFDKLAPRSIVSSFGIQILKRVLENSFFLKYLNI